MNLSQTEYGTQTRGTFGIDKVNEMIGLKDRVTNRAYMNYLYLDTY